MSSHSNRELRTLEAYVKEEMNNPSRSDYYQMQTTQAVLSQAGKKSKNLNEFRLNFQPPKRRRIITQADRERMTQAAKARHRARTGRG